MKRVWSVAIAVVILLVLIAGLVFFLPPTPPSIKSSPESVGICVHSLSANDAQLVADSGAKWIRIDATDNLTEFNASVTNARAYNLSVLAILDSWMFNKSTVFTLDSWQNNVTYYVSQYADYVDAWEIWNEPTSPKYPLLDLDLNSTNPNHEQNMATIVDFYYSMARTAHEIIQKYDSSATVLLLGGVHLWDGTSVDEIALELDRNFTRQLADKNILQYGDAIAVHAYPWANTVDQSVWNGYSDSLSYYRGLFPSDQPLAVWVTETGQNMTGSGEVGQADYLVNAMGFFNGTVSKVFWYSLHENSELEENGFGLIGGDSKPRQAYTKLQEALS